jgi:DNA-directed RNA polymerase specialized sigma24 family protein
LESNPATTPGTRAANRKRRAAEARTRRYLAALYRAVAREAGRRKVSSFDADDLAQAIAEQFNRDPERIMATYPDASLYVRLNFERRRIDWDRRENAQRGAGVNRARTVGALDEAATELGAVDVEHEALAGVALETVFGLLTPAAADLARLILLNGDRVGEVAADQGVHHATVSRRLNAVVEDLRQILGDDNYRLAS